LSYRCQSRSLDDELRAVPTRTPFAAGWAGRSPRSRGSKRRLARLQRQVTRRELVLAVLGAIALLLVALTSLLAELEHRNEHREERRRRSR
jgi:hypothetical protein